MTPWRRPILLFFLLLALFPAISAVAKLAEQGWAELVWWERLLALAFPILSWFWLRHFSILGCQACGIASDSESCKTPE